MIVRVKLRHGRPVTRKQGKNRQLASACGTLLIPAALMAYALGFWRLASDVGVAGNFAIEGLFSHWQIWIAMAAALHVTAIVLNRYGRGGEFRWPRLVSFRAGASVAGDSQGNLSHRDQPPLDGPGGAPRKREKVF
jgi:hypothetical protein